jgi:hypothetical protein
MTMLLIIICVQCWYCMSGMVQTEDWVLLPPRCLRPLCCKRNNDNDNAADSPRPLLILSGVVQTEYCCHYNSRKFVGLNSCVLEIPHDNNKGENHYWAECPFFSFGFWS